jgi:predicted nucleotide-binding protein
VPLKTSRNTDGVHSQQRKLRRSHSMNMSQQVDARKVFVVHGRNELAKQTLFAFLRSIDLSPIEWGEAKSAVVVESRDPNPYVGQILDKGFEMAQATVVLLTPDDEAKLREQFLGRHDEHFETQLMPQPRQNVLFEAGMAMGKQPQRTILLELGKRRPMSDVLGRHLLRIDNSPAKRTELKDLLAQAGCAVSTAGKSEWFSTGDFDAAIEFSRERVEASPRNETLPRARRVPSSPSPMLAQRALILASLFIRLLQPSQIIMFFSRILRVNISA